MEMLSVSNTINHSGIVQKTDNKSVTVIISSESACSGCHAEGSCSLIGKEEKIIEVKGEYNVKVGDVVTVIMKQSSGFTALFLGYILPLAIVIVTLITLLSMSYQELISGLLSIASLLPYYLVLYLFRKKINDKFKFSLIV